MSCPTQRGQTRSLSFGGPPGVAKLVRSSLPLPGHSGPGAAGGTPEFRELCVLNDRAARPLSGGGRADIIQ